MFDIRYFKNHPEVFYSFAHQIYPSNFTPSPCHRWIKTLEDRGKGRGFICPTGTGPRANLPFLLRPCRLLSCFVTIRRTLTVSPPSRLGWSSLSELLTTDCTSSQPSSTRSASRRSSSVMVRRSCAEGAALASKVLTLADWSLRTGSFATASCLRCRRRMPGSEIEYQIMNKLIPVCEPCQLEEKEKKSNRVTRRKKSKKKSRNPWADSDSDSDDMTDADRVWAKKLIPAIIKVRSPSRALTSLSTCGLTVGPSKPDITFFGEELDDRFDKRLQIDRESVE